MKSVYNFYFEKSFLICLMCSQGKFNFRENKHSLHITSTAEIWKLVDFLVNVIIQGFTRVR